MLVTIEMNENQHTLLKKIKEETGVPIYKSIEFAIKDKFQK